MLALTMTPARIDCGLKSPCQCTVQSQGAGEQTGFTRVTMYLQLAAAATRLAESSRLSEQVWKEFM